MGVWGVPLGQGMRLVPVRGTLGRATLPATLGAPRSREPMELRPRTACSKFRHLARRVVDLDPRLLV